jgi:hypothetical protein
MSDPKATIRAPGAVRVEGGLLNRRHPSDGMTVAVDLGGGAVSRIINPLAECGPEWVMRYGDPECIRFSVASLLASYDYLLSGEINMVEATRRLRLLRAARKGLSVAE